MKTRFLQSSPGNNSNTRLMADLVIIVAIIFAQEVLWFGGTNVMLSAAAAGTIFLTMAGPAMAFLFVQKKTETENKPPE